MLSVKGRPEGHDTFIEGEARGPYIFSKWEARRSSSGWMKGRGQKAQAIIGEGETRITRSLSVEWRPESLDTVNEGRPKVQEIIGVGEARKPRSLSVERRPGVVCEMRPEGQAMSAKKRLDGQYNICGSVDKGGQHNCRCRVTGYCIKEVIKKSEGPGRPVQVRTILMKVMRRKCWIFQVGTQEVRKNKGIPRSLGQ